MNMALLGPAAVLAAGALAVLASGVCAPGRASAQPGRLLAAAAVLAALAWAAVAPDSASPPLWTSDLPGRSLQLVFLTAALPLLYFMQPADEVPAALVLASLLGMQMIAISGSFLTLFIGLELMSVPAYLLVARSHSAQALEAAVKYFFAGGAASALFLLGMALHFAGAGSLALAQCPGPLAEAGLALTIAAALFKLGAVPLHFWLPDVYEASDPELAAFFSTGLKAAAALLLLRLAALCQGSLLAALPWIAALTILFGAVLALRQRRLQRLLAYSSISHVGYMILAVAAWAGQGRAATAAGAVVLYLTAYLFMSGGAFLWLRVSGLSERRHLQGLARSRPGQALALATLLLSLAGIPPTAGFAAKFLVFWETFKAGFYVPLVLAGLGSLLSLGYYLGLVHDMYFLEPGPEPATAAAAAPTPRAILAACAVFSVLLGAVPWLVDLLSAGVRP